MGNTAHPGHSSGTSPTLSVIMIVKDEAEVLADCLASVRTIADEIVVADTGSQDDTVAIAQQHGARVFAIPWENDFAKARNRCLAEATGAWLLHMDADEVLDAEGAQAIRALVDADGAGADAVEVTLANYCNDLRAWRWVPAQPGDPMARGYAGYIPVGLLRLFRNGRGFEYREPVHENITESVHERGGVVQAEPGIIIHHYGYAAPPAESRRKAQRYLSIAREKVKQRPGDVKAWHDLAEQAIACGETDTAEGACRKALEINPLHIPSGTSLANILLNRGDLAQARGLLERFAEGEAPPPHILVALGAIDYRQGHIDRARERFELALQVQPNSLQALHFLARIFDVSGQHAEARAYLERALRVAPALDEVRQRFEAHGLRAAAVEDYDRGEVQPALEKLVAALRLDPEDPLTHNALGVVLAALGQRPKAIASFQRALSLCEGLQEARENIKALD